MLLKKDGVIIVSLINLSHILELEPRNKFLEIQK